MKKALTKISDSSGNVILEFTVAVVALFVPISYIATAATQIASSYLEVQNAARAGARFFATSEDEARGRAETKSLVENLLNSTPDLNVSLTCSKNPCLTKDGVIRLQVEHQILLNLPMFPELFHITITGVQSEVVQEIQ